MVALITTGKVEQLALGEFLNKAFPDVEFRSEFTEGFTSARLLDEFDKTPTNAAKLAARLVAAVDPGRSTRRAGRADFAVAVDDVELYNIDQPERIIEVFRDAVREHVEERWPSQDRRQTAFDRLREQASFHLLSPMVESYFYTDENSIKALGLDPDSPRIRTDHDAESFWTDDPDYTQAIGTLADRTAAGRTWTAAQWYERHPKHYLKYLLSPTSPYDPTVKSYKERDEGAKALVALDADTVLTHQSHQTFLRSLINDLADALNAPNRKGDCNPLTSNNGTLLRNI